jgi:hypothetical protein
MYSASKPTAFNTRNDSGKTWFPIPSPGMVMTVYFAMIAPQTKIKTLNRRVR